MQAIEFLLVFTVTIFVVNSLAIALLAQYSEIAETAEDYRQIFKAKQAASAAQCWLNSGGPTALDFRGENISFALDEEFTVYYKGKAIAVKGVFRNDDAEPV